MGNITQGNISFTVNNEEAAGGFATKRTNSSLLSNSKYNVNFKQLLIDGNYEEYGGFSINTIDIDWNNAELPNSDSLTGSSKTIQNSGELLKLINDMQKEIYILTDIIFSWFPSEYWYVGIVSPSDPTNAAENTGNNKWTQLTSTPDSITIYAGPQMPPEVWYIAIPHSYGFQAYDSTGAAPDTAAYTKSQVTIAGAQYDLFTGAGRAPAVNAVFKP